MLASVRENLKGTLVVVVVVIFIIPMVISGVGTGYLGSVAGNEVAKVDGEAISREQLERGVSIRRDQLLQQQQLSADSPMLRDENLRASVLQSLTRRQALINAGAQSGMSVSDAAYRDALLQQEGFKTDGKFDSQRFRMLLRQNNLTPASFRELIESDLIINQQSQGLNLSSFATQAEFAQLVKLTHQKRSFSSIKIPVSSAVDNVSVSDDEIQNYYDANQQRYAVPEKVKVVYVELTLDALAKQISVEESQIREQYEEEIKNFNADANYTVAHILLEDNDSSKIAEIQTRLADGDSFADLAQEYSDDIATNADGGVLGVMSAGMFPSEFENAAQALEEGQVSEPVKTDAGTHFIKLVKKESVEIPSFDERKKAISDAIALAEAREDYALKLDTLGELTFSAENLDAAAAALGLEVQESSFFDRNSGSGIAEDAAVRQAAFDEEVLVNGHNSNTLELGPERALVLRVGERKESYVKSLDDVRALVESALLREKQQDYLKALAGDVAAKLRAGDNAESVANASSYAFASHELVSTSDIAVDRESMSIAFRAPHPDAGPSIVEEQAADGGYWVLEVRAVEEGRSEDLSEQERAGFLAQINQQSANFEGVAYENAVVDDAKIKIK